MRKIVENYVIIEWNIRIIIIWSMGKENGTNADLPCSSINYDFKETANEENGAVGITSHGFLSQCQNPILVGEIGTLRVTMPRFKPVSTSSIS